MTAPAKPAPTPAGPIVQADTLYRASDLYRVLRWEEHSQRQARRRGFPIVRIGRGNYCLGSEVLAWFAAQANAKRTEGQSCQ